MHGIRLSIVGSLVTPNPAVKRDCAKARSPLLLRWAFRSSLCMVNVCAAKLSSRSLAVFQSSTNATARFVESRAALLQMQQRLWPLKISAGFVALRSLVLGLKTQGFVLIFVQNAARRCPIHSGIHPMFGCLPVCSMQTHNWKSVLICLLRPKHPGTLLPRPE